MFKLIVKFLSFTVKLFAAVYISAWLFEALDSLIYKLKRKWRTRGLDPREVKANEIELYYMEHGVQCSKCKCWIPANFERCPVCQDKVMFIAAPVIRRS